MSSPHDYRLYAFVANHYLSPLQCGLQTAHVVSEIASNLHREMIRAGVGEDHHAFEQWAEHDKTIIICGAGNHQGVLDCWAELLRTGIEPGFVTGALFREDEQSMNGMATACGVIVPKKYWDVQFFEARQVYGSAPQAAEYDASYWEHALPDLKMARYSVDGPEGQFISHIKKYRLA